MKSLRRTLTPRAMASSNPAWRLLLTGLVFHLIFIGTVFDCYFTSTVVHGMQQHSLPEAQAKRLVLIVGTSVRLEEARSMLTLTLQLMVCERTCCWRRVGSL